MKYEGFEAIREYLSKSNQHMHIAKVAIFEGDEEIFVDRIKVHIIMDTNNGIVNILWENGLDEIYYQSYSVLYQKIYYEKYRLVIQGKNIQGKEIEIIILE